MNIKVTPAPAEARAATHGPVIAMRRELYVLMYEVAREHRDEAMKVDGKNQAEEIQHSMICILFCYTCLEAFINTVGKDKLGQVWEGKWGKYKESSADDKWLGVSKELAGKKHGKSGSVFNKSKEPFKSFLCLKRIREDLVHKKAEFSEVVETKYGNTEGTINTLNANTADRACKTVKQMVLKLVANMDNTPEVKWVK
jgi:hypothetical protein